MNYGFIKVAAAIPQVKVADCSYNAEQIINLIHTAEEKGVNISVFPELCITGYTCGDLFAQQQLLDGAEKALQRILKETSLTKSIFILGMPVDLGNMLVNAAVVIQCGKILGVVPKLFLPNYKEFYEKRWFASASQIKAKEITLAQQVAPLSRHLIFDTTDVRFGVEICEDLWSPIPPSSFLALDGADIIFNMSADNDCVGKYEYLRNLVSQQAARCIAGYVFASCGFGESTTDVVFAGNAIINEAGQTLAEAERFSLDEHLIISEIDVEKLRNDRRLNTTFAESVSLYGSEYVDVVKAEKFEESGFSLSRSINPHPFVPKGVMLDERCEEILNIQTTGLAQRLRHTSAKTAVIGISGGLDSTLALLVTVIAFDKLGKNRKDVIGVTMPGFGTTNRTYNNAINLMKQLGVTIREISIKASCLQHFADISHNPDNHDVTYENSQARERTQILMDIANQTYGMVIGTGDLSELALGWATYNGDHMSMYGVNTSVPKTLVKHLVKWVTEKKVDGDAHTTLLDIIDTPISPELIPADNNGNIKQITEDIVGPYELHDFFLYNMLRNGYKPEKIYALAKVAFLGTFDDVTIKKWLQIFVRRFFNQQFKRSCLPDGPKVGLCLSPRGDWRMPSDASSAEWIENCAHL